MNLITSIQSGLKKIPKFNRVVVGVSGGVDSVVLAYSLKELGYEVILAHLNHNLRGAESDADEKLVRDLAKEWGLECEIQKTDISKIGNLENNARELRYEFLENVRQKFNVEYIAVAHHFDDQMETVLMHMARGAGLRGQVGMELVNGNVIRPLLDVNRMDILRFADENKIPYRTDRSNFDLSYDRNFWRHLIMPYLKNADCNLRDSIRNISKTAKEKLETICKESEAWLSKNFTDGQFVRDEFNKLSDELKSEIIIQILGAEDLYQKSINRIVDFINNGQSGKNVEVKGKTFQLQHSNVLVHQNDNNLVLPKAKITITGIKWGNYNIKSSKAGLYVRQWKNGDKFRPGGMNGHKKLQDFFVDNKIPLNLRHQIPIIVDENDDIMSVGNMRLANGAENLKNDLIIN